MSSGIDGFDTLFLLCTAPRCWFRRIVNIFKTLSFQHVQYRLQRPNIHTALITLWPIRRLYYQYFHRNEIKELVDVLCAFRVVVQSLDELYRLPVSQLVLDAKISVKELTT